VDNLVRLCKPEISRALLPRRRFVASLLALAGGQGRRTGGGGSGLGWGTGVEI